MASLINGTLAHTVEMDDHHRESTLQPGAAIIPAALAIAEMNHNSGKELLEAILAGYEVMIRIGEGFQGTGQNSGWHLTGICGVFGAAVACGKLLGLDSDGLSLAMGIAGSTASGLQEWKENGSWTKRLQAGNAASNGVIAAFLARKGYTGPLTVLEGEYGFYKAYSNKSKVDLQVVVDKLGEKYKTFETSFKPYACSRLLHPVIDCILSLVEKHNLKPQDIEDVLVKTNNYAISLLTTPLERKLRPSTMVDAQFSLPYTVAAVLTRHNAGINEFTGEVIKNPSILELAAKVRWEVEPEFEKVYPHYYPASVTIRNTAGQELTSSVKYPKGDPENPLTDDELADKFRSLASRAIARKDWIENIYNAVMEVEKFTNINQLTQIL
jgi:2-methylcitrate dehydratase PrpD